MQTKIEQPTPGADVLQRESVNSTSSPGGSRDRVTRPIEDAGASWVAFVDPQLLLLASLMMAL